MSGHPYTMASARTAVQFPMPSTGRGSLYAIWEDTASVLNQELPNPYDRFQRTPDPQPLQPATTPPFQGTPRLSPVAATPRPNTYHQVGSVSSPHNVAETQPIIRHPRSSSLLRKSPAGSRPLSAKPGDYFSYVPPQPSPEGRQAPQLRHAQSAPYPVHHQQTAHQPPLPPKPRQSCPAPHSAPYGMPYSYANTTPGHAPDPPHPHPRHSVALSSSSQSNHTAPNSRSGSPKPILPPRPSVEDAELARAIEISKRNTHTRPPSLYNEDAALAQALQQSLVDIGRPASPQRRSSSSNTTSSSGHGTDGSSTASSSRMSSPYSSPRPSSSAPRLAFFPRHHSRASFTAAAMAPGAPTTHETTQDAAQALRMRSTSIETVLPKDGNAHGGHRERGKSAPRSAPPTEQIPHAMPSLPTPAQQTARSKSEVGPSRRLSPSGPRDAALPKGPQTVVGSPSLSAASGPAAKPSHPGLLETDMLSSSNSHSATVDEKHGPLSAVSTEESESSSVSSTQQQLVPQELLMGISMGFGTAPIVAAESPFQGAIPTLISLPYGDKAPFYIQAPNWRSLLKFMARLPTTRIEPSADALQKLKGEARLRVVVSFVKVHSTSSQWLTALYMSIDHPVPVNAPNAVRYRNGDSSVLPWSYTLASPPAVLRDGADAPISKFYTVPSNPGNLYPTLPATFPDLAMYLASSLEVSRKGLPEMCPGLRRLSKLIDTLYPEDPSDTLGNDYEKPGMRQKLKNFVGLGSKPQRSRNAEMYDLVTPFVPDDYGH